MYLTFRTLGNPLTLPLLSGIVEALSTTAKSRTAYGALFVLSLSVVKPPFPSRGPGGIRPELAAASCVSPPG